MGMNSEIVFQYDQSLVHQDQVRHEADRLVAEIAHMREVSTQNKGMYSTEYEFMQLPFDDALFFDVNTLVKEKKALRPTLCVIIGIGGSNLGTLAVLQALYGAGMRKKGSAPRIAFADTVDTAHIGSILETAEHELKQGCVVLVVVISKSGTTIETTAIFDLFFSLLRSYRPHDFASCIVAISNFGSFLWNFASEYGISRLSIPEKVGGRFSLFSSVGLFPLGIMGIDLDELRSGARSITHSCTTIDISQNHAALRALILYIQYQQGINIHDLFLFSPDLHGFGLWYRQLMGESIGKALDLSGAAVHVGITPTVSIGSTDLHSVAQLYLGGPFDKITTFVTIENTQPDLLIKTSVSGLEDRSIGMIMEAIIRATLHAYRIAKRPYMHVHCAKKSASIIGQLLQLHMIEMVYLGYLLRINPFDQPNVEGYKKETRQLLGL